MLMHVSWANASLVNVDSAARPSPMTARGRTIFESTDPDARITSGAVIAFAMTLNELCTNATKF